MGEFIHALQNLFLFLAVIIGLVCSFLFDKKKFNIQH
ncbi:hypothetical protein SAMN05444955_1155 [Lihuaxuella thermophila]|uniref:Uncharacterized protein n=1 Tax=Lihuaxuella thermophila TaxID=1173111 RepID=A0A1H8HRG0_9BACL|nr:hypothetical protein SAMN05444955_1155 [Lihuaxuella thermophila]